MKILISDAFHESLPERLKKFGEVTDDKNELPTADVVLVRSKTKCTAEYLDAAPQLKMIIRGGVGLDNIDLDYAARKGVKVFNTAAASSIAVAELALAHLVAIPNRLIEGHMTMKAGQWAKKELKRTELFGKTLGLIGIGRIGTEVAVRAKAFGMAVIAHDLFVKRSPHAKLVSLEELLERSDFISLHTPLTDTTRGMVNRQMIDQMKTGVILINTGRGKVVDEADLAAALAGGKVRAYGTDVWESDPPPETSPLLTAPNVFMTPHIGASSRENLLRIGDIIVELLEEHYGDPKPRRKAQARGAQKKAASRKPAPRRATPKATGRKKATKKATKKAAKKAARSTVKGAKKVSRKKATKKQAGRGTQQAGRQAKRKPVRKAASKAGKQGTTARKKTTKKSAHATAARRRQSARKKVMPKTSKRRAARATRRQGTRRTRATR